MNNNLLIGNHTKERSIRVRGLVLVVHYLLISCFVCSAFSAEDIVLRASVTPREVWIGQRAILQIDVLGKDGWAQIKRIGDFDVPGAYVMRKQSQGTRLQETIGEISYSGQRYEISLFPQRGGRVEIPALPVEVTIKTWGLNAPEIAKQAKIPGTMLTCKVPPGAEGIRGLISTTKFMASQTWEPETDHVEVGDAVKRTIMLQASDVPGMAFAPAQHPTIGGLGIYPGEPTVEDVSAHGSLTGKRIETVTYVFERSGGIEIPGVVLSWWDTGTRELKSIKLPGVALRVVGNSTATSEPATSARRQQKTLLPWLALIAVVIAAVVVVHFRRRVLACWYGWWEVRRNSEAMYFRSVMKSIRSGDPKATIYETMRWLDRINDDQQPARLDLFLSRYGDAQTQEAAIHLTGSLESDSEKPYVSAFLSGLASARNRWRQAQHAKRQAMMILPELNGPRRV